MAAQAANRSIGNSDRSETPEVTTQTTRFPTQPKNTGGIRCIGKAVMYTRRCADGILVSRRRSSGCTVHECRPVVRRRTAWEAFLAGQIHDEFPIAYETQLA